MSDLAGLLGQNVLATEILEELQDPDVIARRLTGPPGSGKSHIARMVATAWRESEGNCVVAVGDDDRSWRQFYPFLSGLSRAHRDWVGLAATGTRSALQVADAATVGSGAGASIFDLLAAAFRQRTERVLKPYSDAEKDIILDLRRIGRSKRLLLVADNAHWWDVDSLRLLNDLLSDELRGAIRQLSSMAVLVVDTSEEQEPLAAEDFAAVVEKRSDRVFRTQRCNQAMFPRVLEGFGLEKELPEEIVEALFTVTGGHLKLVEQVVAYAEQNELEPLLSSDRDDYLSTLVSARCDSLGPSGSEVVDLLIRAAVLGLDFTERDLSCIAEKREVNVRNLVERAEKIGFVLAAKGRISFSHDVIREAMLHGQERAQLRPLYEKLSECLALLRPGDYAARAQALLQAGDLDRARDFVVLSAVNQLRRGQPPSRVVQSARLSHSDDPELISYLERIGKAYEAVDAGDFESPLRSLQTPLAADTFVMAAEKNYLAALCLMELETGPAVSEALTILRSWLSQLEEEVELKLRFLCLLQQAQIHAEQFDEARKTERTIEQELLRRGNYDVDAAVMLQVQNRRAGAVSVPEVAEERIEEAVAFFEQGTEDMARDQLELFRSLTNLAGIQLRLGTDAKAYENAKKAEGIALMSPHISHRLDVLASNLVLAGYRSGALSLSEAVDQQELVVKSPEGLNDDFLQRCNLAAFRLLAGDDDGAAADLDCLGEELQSSEREESFLVYHWTALAVASAAFRGDMSEATRRHGEMESLVAHLKWPGAPYVRRRQKLIGELLPRLQVSENRAEADLAMLTEYPDEVGAAWPYYARLVPGCELSFWSDS